jgi:hypothetical protein
MLAAAIDNMQQTLLSEARRLNPGFRFAASRDGTAIGMWFDDLGRFATIYGKAIDGHWFRMNGKEFMADGQPMFQPEDWIE